MSTNSKRKVQFGKDEVREFKRSKQELEAEAELEDDIEEETRKKEQGTRLNGYSLDSDEEDEEQLDNSKSRYELKDEDKHEALDQEFTDGGVKVTGFNLDEEMEEGHFDDAGNYIENKDDEHAGDVWLQGAATYVAPTAKATGFTPNFEDDAAEEAGQDERPEILRKMLTLMTEGESVNQSLRRLGGTGGTQTNKWKSQKKKNKSTGDAGAAEDTTKLEINKEAFDQMSSYTNRLAAVGEYDIYQYKFEKIQWEVKKADDAMKSDTVLFEFKWTEEATDVYGPYPADKMLEWQDSGYFKKGVFCRELKKGDEEAKFYNSARIDFDLYT